MRGPHIASATCALLSVAVAITACGADHAHTAADAAATSRPATASAPGTTAATPPPPASPTATTPPPSPASAPAPAPPVLARVVADCTSAPPHRPSVRPVSITLACADDGLGVEKMTWNSWTASAATGQGRLWEKLCHPNCADGKIGTYPVSVTLSAVKSSSSGPWFSRLTVAFQAQRPPGTLPGSFGLMKP